MIFNTLIKGGGGITGKPIEVTELPTPTASDVDKIYLLKEENTTYLSPQVGQPFGNKIYFNTELNPLDYTSNFQGGTDLLRTETTDEYYSLAFVDILALQGVEGYGHAYIIGVANGALSTIIGITYIYCDVLSVDQFNAMIGSQFGISISKFGWLANEIDTSAIADRIVNTNILPAFDNIAYTSTESTFKEEYYKCVEIKDTIEVGKPVPNILYFDTSKTPEFDRSAAPTQTFHLLTQDQYFTVVSSYNSGEGVEDLDGSFELLALMFDEQIPVVLYVGGTASLEVINNLMGMFGEITHKGWQIDGTLNIPEKGLEIATNLGLSQAEFEQALALAFADPVVTFNDPQGLFLFPKTYEFEPLGESGFPIEVEELPVATEDDIGKVYLNTTTNEYYEVVNTAPITVGTILGATIKCDTSKTPIMSPPESEIRILVATALDGDSGVGIMEWGYFIVASNYISGDTKVQTVYVPDVGTPMADINNMLAQFGAQPITEWGWQTDTITTDRGSGMAVETLADEQGLFLVEGVQTAFCNGDVVYATENEKEAIKKTLINTIEGDDSYSLAIPEGTTKIRMWAFYRDYNLRRVTVPDSVTEIDHCAFQGCSGLTSVVIGDGVTSLTYEQFKDCPQLRDIAFGRNINSIDAYSALYGCYNLENISVSEDNSTYKSINGDLYTKDGQTIVKYAVGKTEQNYEVPSGITTIGHGAYAWQSASASIGGGGIVNLRIGQMVEVVEGNAFMHSGSLKTVWIGPSVKTLGFDAFRQCDQLKEVEIGDSLTEIKARAFYDCTALEKFTIHALTPPAIGSSVFYNRPSTMEIFVPLASIDAYKTAEGWSLFADRIRAIPTEGLAYTLNTDGASYSVSGIGTATDTDIVIPSTYEGLPVTKIGSSAFSRNANITSVTIPDSVTSIGNSAFYNCTSLPSITIPNSVTSIGNNAFDSCPLTSIVIPNRVDVVSQAAFQNCSSLTSVTIGNSVTSIGSSAFKSCTSLTSIVIPDSVTSIGSSAFSGCSSLTSVVIGDSVGIIGSFAFQNCTSLPSITIPDSVTSISDRAFSGCANCLKYDFSNCTSVPTLGSYAFISTNVNAKIIVPDSLYDSWIAATNWSNYASKIIKASEYTEA